MNSGNGLLPYRQDDEKGVISSLIQEPAWVGELCERRLTPDWFYNPSHQIVYKIALQWTKAEKIDFIWLKDELNKSGHLDEVGGPDFLNDLYNFIPTGKNVDYYIDGMLDAWRRRNVILDCQRRENAARDDSEPPESFDPENIFGAPLRLGTEVFGVQQLLDFDRVKDDASVIGNRWLCKGDSLLISGPTGIGKSSFAMQALIHWALGRKFFGIQIAAPQKVLVIQSENNRGDLAISFQDICNRIGITRKEETLLAERMVFVRESEKTGEAFIRLARNLVKKHEPGIVLADPLLSYVGGDVNRQEVMSLFLRNGIQPLLNETGIIWVFVHHTGKPPREQAGKPAGGNAYSALGSSEILNWPREVLTFGVRDWDNRVFGLEFRKRARQSGITAPDGSLTYELVIRHSEEGVVWEPCSEDEIVESEPEVKGRKAKFSGDQLVSLLGDESWSYTTFQ